jgi:hypothetical protein
VGQRNARKSDLQRQTEQFDKLSAGSAHPSRYSENLRRMPSEF